MVGVGTNGDNGAPSPGRYGLGGGSCVGGVGVGTGVGGWVAEGRETAGVTAGGPNEGVGGVGTVVEAGGPSMGNGSVGVGVETGVACDLVDSDDRTAAAIVLSSVGVERSSLRVMGDWNVQGRETQPVAASMATVAMKGAAAPANRRLCFPVKLHQAIPTLPMHVHTRR